MIATTSFLQNWFHKPDCPIPAEKFILDHTQISSESLRLQQDDNLQHAFSVYIKSIGSKKNAKQFMQELYIIYTETHENKPGTYTALKYVFPIAEAVAGKFPNRFKTHMNSNLLLVPDTFSFKPLTIRIKTFH